MDQSLFKFFKPSMYLYAQYHTPVSQKFKRCMKYDLLEKTWRIFYYSFFCMWNDTAEEIK